MARPKGLEGIAPSVDGARELRQEPSLALRFPVQSMRRTCPQTQD